MATQLRAKLASERADTNWKDLEASGHLPVIVVVTRALDLVEVGIALAENDAARVKGWLDSGGIHRPTEDELTTWRANAEQSTFDMIVVQPFVLVQETGAVA